MDGQSPLQPHRNEETAGGAVLRRGRAFQFSLQRGTELHLWQLKVHASQLKGYFLDLRYPASARQLLRLKGPNRWLFAVAKRVETRYTIPGSQIEMESDVIGRCSVPQGVRIRQRFCARTMKPMIGGIGWR